MAVATSHLSIAVVVSAGGVILDADALCGMPRCLVMQATLVSIKDAACGTVNIVHECPCEVLRDYLDAWADARGWCVTVAPLLESG